MIEAMTEIEKSEVLFWVTGYKRLPVGGFSALPTRFNIKIVDQPGDFLPVSHTCFFTLELPKYTSQQQLTTKINQAVHVVEFGLA